MHQILYPIKERLCTSCVNEPYVDIKHTLSAFYPHLLSQSLFHSIIMVFDLVSLLKFCGVIGQIQRIETKHFSKKIIVPQGSNNHNFRNAQQLYQQ